MRRFLRVLGRLASFVPASLVVSACIDASSLNEGGTSGADAAPAEASSPGDAGGSDGAVDAAKTCAPGSVAGFTPVWKPPTGRNQAKCNSTQVDTYVECLFSQAANDPTCRDYLSSAANAVCAGCLMSQLDDAQYGPFIRLSADAITVNVEGCVALMSGDAQPTSCAAKAQALGQCRAAACDPNCVVTDHASLLQYNSCEDAAGSSVCKSYLDASSCINALLGPGGSASNCASGPTPLDAAKGLAKVFCL